MTQPTGRLVCIAAGSLLLGPVVGLLLGSATVLVGVSHDAAMELSLALGLLLVWVGQAVVFRRLWGRVRKTDRSLAATGTLTVLLPIVGGVLVLSWLR